MGCDFYYWEETVIEYADAMGGAHQYIEEGQAHRGYDEWHGDRDFTGAYYNCLGHVITEYGRKPLYEAGMWVCSAYGKTRVESLCAVAGIRLGAVTQVYKRMNGYNR